MTVLCGTDFSEGAADAERIAAMLAARLDQRLHLVHVLDAFGELEPGAELKPFYAPARTALQEAAAKARELRAVVEETITSGDAAEALARIGAESAATVVVVAAISRPHKNGALLGRVAERLARRTSIPILIVHGTAHLEAWIRGERALKVMVFSDLSESSDAAVRWIAELRKVGPCDVTLAHVAWPPGAHHELGIHRPMDLEHLDPEVERALGRELRSKVEGLPGAGTWRFLVRQGFGRPDRHLVGLAEEAGADLVVVGSHRRNWLLHLWHGSVSRGVLHLAASSRLPMSAACVPAMPPPPDEVAVPVLRQVLVTTDFTDLADAAIPFAYSLLPDGGTVHLVHVLESRPSHGEISAGEAVDRARRELERRIPDAGRTKGVRTDIHVLQGPPAREIAAAAERVGVDAVCIGSHGRTGLAASVLGSVAQGVLARSRRPVFVVCPKER